MKFSSLRVILAVAASRKMAVQQLDVKTAFLHGDLEEEIYMEQPEGYMKEDRRLVLKLKKALYGLKQASRCWNSTFTAFVESIGFKQSPHDPCVFTRTRKEEVILAIYVDDIIIASNSTHEVDEIKSDLPRRFTVKDLCNLSFILGIHVEQKDGRIKIHQRKYLENILKKFGFEDCKPISTPFDVNVKLHDDGTSKAVDVTMYQQMVGSLLYICISLVTRPDIAYAVGVVSRFNSQPKTAHLNAVKRIFRYLKGTLNAGLEYADSKLELH